MNFKKILFTSIISLGFAISVNAKALDNLGKEITLKDKTKISEIMGNPENFVGKNVLVEGKVVDVCTERGCWMKVSSDKKRESMTIKVKDGEMVFPIAARGKNVLVEGELFKVVMKKKEAEEMKKDGHDHHEKKEGKTVYMFKPKGVKFSD
ncbi:MAG: DUF4920 domain-containing protein [Candidatus Sericytochromatia bacterium]